MKRDIKSESPPSALSAASGDDNASDHDNDAGDDFMKRLSKRPTRVTQRRTSGRRQQAVNKGLYTFVLCSKSASQ